jgi:hypothetical protein
MNDADIRPAVVGQVEPSARKPWQVVLHYAAELGMLTMRVASHTHGSSAFTDFAAE